MTTARLSFQQRSYAKCKICHQTMYSWNSRSVPIFTLMNASESEGPQYRIRSRSEAHERGVAESDLILSAHRNFDD